MSERPGLSLPSNLAGGPPKKNGGAQILRFPALGWCVRPGIYSAHYLVWHRGRVVSACGCVRRVEEYVPHRLRPLQADKPRCSSCERELRRTNDFLGGTAA